MNYKIMVMYTKKLFVFIRWVLLFQFVFCLEGYSQLTKSQTVCPDEAVINIGQNGGLNNNGIWSKSGDPTFNSFGDKTNKTTTVTNLDLGLNTLIYNDGIKTLTESVTNYKVFAGPGQNICGTGVITSVVLDGSNPGAIGTGLWSLTAGDPLKVSILDPTQYNTQVNINSPGTYTFKWTVTFTPALNCNGPFTSSSSSVSITVAGPNVNITGGTSSAICPGNSLTLVASGGGTYLWDNGATTASRTVSPSSTTTYNVTVTDGAGCKAVKYSTVSVNNTFTLSSSAPSYCAGTSGVSVTLSGSESGVSYQLKKRGTPDTNEQGSKAGNGAPITWNNILAGSYYVLATNTLSACTMTMGDITVMENPLPPVNAGSDVIGCEGNTFTLSVSGANTYLWNTGATTTSINVSPASTTTYSVTGTVTSTGCTFTDAVVVTINLLPAKFAVSGSGSYCQANAGLTVDLSGSVLGVNYQLLNGGVAVAGGLKAGTGGVLSWNNLKAGTYTVSAANANCSVLMNGSTVITEVPLPTIYTLSGPSSYCANTNGVTLTLSGSQAGINYTLKKGGMAVGTIPGTGIGLTWSNITLGTYTVEASTVNPIACPIAMNGSVTVAALPVTVVSAGAPKTICLGESVQLGATGGSTYSWAPAASLDNAAAWNPVASPASTTLYTVTFTDNNGCIYTDQVQVTVNALPDAVASTNQTICNGDIAVLTATDNITGNNETYLWSTGSTTDVITVNPSTNTTYNVTITDANLCKNSASTSVIVNQKPGVNAGSDTETCLGTSVTLNGSGDADTWVWSTSPAATTLSVIVNPAVTTNYILRGTLTATGCYTEDVVEVVVNPLPVVSFTLNGGINTKFCSNGAGVTLAGIPAGGTFTSTAIGSTSGTSFSPSIAGLGNHTIVYTYTNSNSCTNSVSTPVEVIAPPVPTITGLNASYCNTESPFIVDGNPPQNGSGVFGTWSFSGPLAAITDNLNGTCTVDPSKITIEGTYSLTYTVLNSGSCSGSVTQNFLVKMGPSVNFVGLPASVCQNATTVTLTGNQGVFGTFSGSGITDNANGTATFNSNVLVPGNYSITFSYTNPSSCTANITKSITVNTIPAIYNVTGGGSYCVGGAGVNVGLTGSELLVDYELFRNGISTGTIVPGNGLAIDFGLQLLSGNYTVTAKNATLCTVAMNGSVNVNTIALPTVFTLSGPSDYCAGTSGVTLTLSDSQIGVTYTLKNGGAVVGTKNGTDVALTWTDITTGNYTVEATVNPGLCPVAMLGSVTVNVPVAAPIANAGADKTICIGGSTTLNASGGTTYLWSPAAGLSSVTVVNPVASPAATTLYTVTVTNSNGCSSTATVWVTVRPLPNAVASASQTICNGDLAMLSATDNIIGNNETYLWSNGSTNDTTIVKPSTNTTYTVTITDAFGCKNSASTSVSVNQKPGVNAGSDTKICLGSSVTLNGGGDANTWSWSTGATTLSIVVAPSSTTNYILTGVYTATGCFTTDTVKVSVNNPPIVTFTLNGAMNTQFCSNGALVTLLGNPVGGNFSSSAPGAVSGTKFDPKIAAVGNHTINYTYTDINGCIGSKSIIVEVIAPPVVTITGVNLSYCNTAAPFTLSGNPLQDGNNNFGIWTSTNIGVALVDNGNGTCTINPSLITVQGNYNLTYTVSNSSLCFNSATKTFDIKLSPSVDFVGIPVSSSICKNANTINLTGNQGNGGSFAGPGITDNANGTATFNPIALLPGNYAITFTYTDPVNLCIATTSKPITVNDVPAQFSVTGGGAYCDGTPGIPVGLSGSTVGINYELFLNGFSTGAPVAGSGAAITFGNRTLPGTYTVTATNAATLCTAPMIGSALVSITPLPLDAQVITGLGSVCPASTQNYSIPLIQNADTYIWQVPANATITSGVGTASISVSFTNPPATGDISVYGKNICGLGALSKILATVNPLPASNGIITGDQNICQAESNIIYKVTPITDATSYLWTVPSGATIFSGQGTETIVVNYSAAALSGNITVKGVNACGNGNASILPVIVSATPQLTLNVPSGNITCSGANVTLSATSSTPNPAFSWSAFNGGNIVSLNNLPSISVSTAGSYIIKVTEPVNSCISIDTVVVMSDVQAPLNADILFSGVGEITCLVPQLTLTATTTSSFPLGYNWTASSGGNLTSGNMLANATIDKGGVYEVKITNLNTSCFTTKSITIPEITTKPDITVTNPEDEKLSCSKKTVTLFGNSITSGVSYSWTGPATGIKSGAGTSTPVVELTGTYTLIVTAPNGCSSSTNVQVVSDNSLPDISVNTNPGVLNCFKDTVTLKGSSTTTGAILLWSGTGLVSGANTEKPIVNKAGTFTLTVTHPITGCTAAATVDVIQNITPPSVIFPVIPSTITCAQPNITIKSSTSAINKTYQWSSINGSIVSGGATQDVVVSKGGTYTLLITDTDNGCSASASTDATEDKTLPDAQIAVPADITCAPPSSIQLNGSSVTTPINVSWTTTDGNITSGSASLNPTVNKAGTYFMKVTNTNTQCFSIASVLVAENKAGPNITISKTPAELNCASPLVTLNGTAANSTLVWTGPAGSVITNPSSQTPTVNKAGRYYLTATNAFGCVSKDSTDVTGNLLKPQNLTIDDPGTLTCISNPLILKGNSTTASATYKWTPLNGGIIVSADNGNDVTISAAGDYKMVVTHPSSFCKDSLSFTVIKNIDEPVINFPATPVIITCTQLTSVLNATVTPVGSALLWTGPGTISSAIISNPTVNAAGTYTLKATHPVSGCIITSTLVVPEDKVLPVFSIAAPQSVTCTQPNVLLDATTGLIDFTAKWSTTNGLIVGVDNTIDALAGKEGLYTLNIINNLNGCNLSQNVLVTPDNSQPNIMVDPNPAKITCTVTEVELFGTSATAGVSLLWTGPGGITDATSQRPKVNDIGIYTLTVTGTNGCKSTANVIVTDDKTYPAIPAITAPAKITCANKIVNLEISSVLTNSDILWTTSGSGKITNEKTSIATVDAIGTYTVTVTDRTSGCTSQNTVIVTEDKAVSTATIIGGPYEISCSSPTLQLEGTTPTGINPNWTASSGGRIVSDATSLKPTIDAAGTYTLTVTNPVTGCTSNDVVVVTKSATLPGLSIDPFPAELNCTVTEITLTGQPTEAGTTFTWIASPGNITSGSNTFNPKVDQPGSYILTVTKTATGCKSIAAIDVVQNITAPQAVIAVPEKFTCVRNEVQLNASSTDLNVSTLWTTSGIGNIKAGEENYWNPKVSTPETYTLTVTNLDNQCTTVRSIVVSQDIALPDVSVDKTILPLTCTRKQVTISGTSLKPGAIYLWTTVGLGNISNPASQNPSVDAIGTYTLKVTNPANGCSKTDFVTITDDLTPPQIWVNTTPSVLNCTRDTVFLKGSSTTANVNYLWSGPGNIPNNAIKEPYVDSPGTYILTVTSAANGCSGNLPVTVIMNKTIPAAPLLISNSACLGAPATALTAVGNGIQWYSNAALGNVYKVQSGNSYTPLSLSLAGDYNFYATQTDPVSQCPGATSQVIYTIRPLPASPVNINKTICEGDPDKTLTASGNNIKWYNTPGGVSIASGAFAPAVSAPGTYTYYTTQTDINNCESPAKDISLIIQPTPPKPNVNQLAASVCFGKTNPIFTASGTNLNWYTSPSLPAPVKSGGSFTPLETTAGTYQYYVTQTSSFGCVSAYETVTLNINTLAQPFTVTGGGVYCENTAGLQVGLSGSQLNTTYQLLLNGTTVVTSLNGSGAALNFGLQKATGNYTVIAKNANSCESVMSGGVSILSNSVPDKALNITGQTNVCESAVNIAYSIPAVLNAASYTWNVPSGAIITSGLNTPSITIDFAPGSVTGQVNVYAENVCGTGAISPNLQVVVTPMPVASGNIKFYAGNNVICLGDSGKIYEVDPIANAKSYEWILPAGASVYAGANSRQIRVRFASNAATGIQNVKVRGVNSCGAGAYLANYVITVNPNPSVYAGIDQNLCSQLTTLQGSAIPAGGTGLWNQILGNAAIINNSLANSQITDVSQGLNLLTWKITFNGCSSFDTVKITNNQLFVDAGEGLPICSQSVVLKGSKPPVGTNSIWTVASGSASFVAASINNTTASNFGYGDNKLYWTVTKSGCESRDSITITSYRPLAPDAGADQIICFSNSVLAATPLLYGTGKWSVFSGQASFANILDPKTAISSIGKGKNVLIWTVTNMICSLSDTVIINNNELAVNAGYDQVVCENRTSLEASSPVTGSSGQWSVLQGSASFLDSKTNNTKVSGLVNGANKLIWSITKGNCVNTDTITIICNMPSSTNAGPDQFLASGNAILEGNLPAVGTGKWSVISGAAVFTNSNLYNTSASGLNPGNNTLRWTITYNNCNTYDDVVITNGTIEKVDAGQDQIICTNQTTLEAARPQYGFGIWTVQKGSANFENNESYNSKVTNLAAGNNILRWSVVISGVEFYDTITIVNNQPTQSITGPKQILCIDSSSLTGNIPVQGTGKWTLEGGAAVIQDAFQNNSKVTGLSSGENIFRWTITKGICVSSTLLVITNDKTTLANAGLDQTLCDDKTTLIPNPAYVGTGEWSVVSGSGRFSNSEVTGLARGQNILRWTIRKNNCSSYDDMVVISHKPTTASAGINTIVCVDSLFLSANKQNTAIGETGKWAIMNGSGLIKDTALNTSLVSKLAQGVNVLRWTINNNGCISYSDVSVNYAFVSSDAGINISSCDNHVILNANNPSLGAGEWSIVGGSGSAVFTDPSSPNTEVKNLDQGKNILKWTISNFSCYSSSEVIISNNAPSVSFAGGDQSSCINTSVMAARQPLIGKGTWSVLSGSGMFADSSSYNSKIFNVGSGANTYRWTIRNLNCVSIDEVVINSNKPIGTYAGLDQTLCLDSARLSANQPIVGAGVWSITKGAGQISDIFSAVASISKLAPDTNVVRWTVSNKQCVEFQEIKIVNNQPTIPSAGADRILCSDQATMDGNSPLHGFGEWIITSGSGTFSNKNIYNTNVSGLTPGKNTLRWKISKQGCILYDDVQLTNDLPSKPLAGTDISVCDNNSPLNANKPAIGIGYWSIISGKGVFIDSTQYNTRIVGLGQGSNLLSWTTVHNRCALTDIVDVRNNLTNVFAGPDQTVYENSSFLVSNEPLRGVGIWTLNGGGGTISSPNNYESSVSGLEEGINTFLWSVDISGCLSSDAVQITYYRLPTASFSVNQTEGCPPFEVRFTKTTVEKYPFSWSFGENDSVSNEENPVYLYDKPGKYSAKLIVTGPDGKPVEMAKTIIIRELPVVNFDLTSSKVYIPEQELRCFNYSSGGKSYLWDFGDDKTSTDLNPIHMYEDSGSYSVKLVVTSQYGCVDSLKKENAVEVFESSRIKFPSAFTPNSNGATGGAYNRNDYSNDVFYPIVINGEIQNYNLEIYNRWGVLIFKSNDINIGWDGYYKGNLMVEDVYIFRVTGQLNSGKKIGYTGDFMLMHNGL